MFKKKLNDILGTFTKVQDDLVVFLEANKKEVDDTETKLKTLKDEQETAETVLKNVYKILGK